MLRSEVGHVDLHPIVWDRSGAGVQTGLDGETFDYPAGSLDAEGRIAGRTVRCGTPELQLVFHAHYEPREHDRRDMAALAAEFVCSCRRPIPTDAAARSIRPVRPRHPNREP